MGRLTFLYSGGTFNPQQQFPVRWPDHPVVGLAWLDQLQRDEALAGETAADISATLRRATAGPARCARRCGASPRRFARRVRAQSPWSQLFTSWFRIAFCRSGGKASGSIAA